MGDAGVELDRLLRRAVPAKVVAQIDDSVNLLAKKPPVEEESDEEPPQDETDRLGASISASAIDLDELAEDQARANKGLIPLVNPDPTRFLQGELHELWKEAINALAAQARGTAPGGAKPGGHRHIPLGSFRVVVVASISRQGGRAGRHPGHVQQASRDDHPVVSHHRLVQQADPRRLALPRQQPGHHPPRLSGHTALRALERPTRPAHQVRRPRRRSRTSSKSSAWNSPTSSTEPSPAASDRGTASENSRWLIARIRA